MKTTIKQSKGHCSASGQTHIFFGILNEDNRRYICKLHFVDDGNQIEIVGLETLDKYKNQGFATILMKFFIEKFKNRNIWLYACPFSAKFFDGDWDAATELLTRFYAKYGFVASESKVCLKKMVRIAEN